MTRQEATLAQASNAAPIDRRLYNVLTFGLVTLSFGITWLMYNLVNQGVLQRTLGLANPLVLLVVSLVGTFGGILLMTSGKKRQSTAMSFAGYSVFSLTFGAMLALVLARYSIGTISYAFAVTACISGIFLIAGVVFPGVFSRIGGVLTIGLVGLIVAELIATFVFHANQTILDYIGILLFGGCLGYYSYCMSVDEPTVPNAVFYATDIYLAIVNILLRVLEITNRR